MCSCYASPSLPSPEYERILATFAFIARGQNGIVIASDSNALALNREVEKLTQLDMILATKDDINTY